MAKLFLTIVLDGVGIGAQPDAAAYQDEGSHTLGHVCAGERPHLPHLETLGLGCIEPLAGVSAVQQPLASFGKMTEVSAGKDSTTGHWELAGIHLDAPFPTFPDGFPPDMIATFLEKTGCAGVLGNRAASGTAIIDVAGETHQQTGHPIIYTSADSVFQVAAHKDTLPLEALYRMCEIARAEVCIGKYGVGRVIARPFVGTPGAYQRVSAERKDYALQPPAKPLQTALREAGVRTVSVGKISDLFGGVGFDESYKTKSNEEGVDRVVEVMRQTTGSTTGPTFVWVNLVDFDQEFGHRNDPEGFAGALEAFDRALPAILAALPEKSALVITADHGNDPTTPGTDHSREYVPVLYYVSNEDGKAAPGRNLGIRATFADHAATVASYFEAPFDSGGSCF